MSETMVRVTVAPGKLVTVSPRPSGIAGLPPLFVGAGKTFMTTSKKADELYHSEKVLHPPQAIPGRRIPRAHRRIWSRDRGKVGSRWLHAQRPRGWMRGSRSRVIWSLIPGMAGDTSSPSTRPRRRNITNSAASRGTWTNDPPSTHSAKRRDSQCDVHAGRRTRPAQLASRRDELRPSVRLSRQSEGRSPTRNETGRSGPAK